LIRLQKWYPALIVLLLTHSEVSWAVDFYISPLGSDSNPGSEAQPFATLERARDAVRAVNMTGDVVVYLRAGTYRLANTVVFDQSDSGRNGFQVIYRSYPGEQVVLSGGERISGWTSVGGGNYRASVGTLRFRQLYVNGSRAQRARTPNAGSWYQMRDMDEGGRRFEVAASEIANWQRLNEVELISPGRGVNQGNMRIASFTLSGGSAFVVPREPERTRRFEQFYPPKDARPYYFENALEFIDQPGEWYLNTASNELTYRPRPGEDMATVEVMAPRLEQLISVEGTLNEPVHDIEFIGLTFAHSNWLLPSQEGFVGDQAFTIFTEVLPDDEITSYPGVRHPAGVHVEAANNIRFERNKFQHMGSSGLNLHMATQDVAVIGNVFADISAGGLAVDLNLEGNPADGRKITRRPVIRNNYFTGTAKDYFQNTAIALGYVEGGIVEHNEVTDTKYTGITVGWGWDDRDNAARDNLVRYNEVWNVLTLMADGGGIYTLSRQPGTQVVENYVHDIVRTPTHGGYNISGIYLDEGSNLITVRDNVLVRSGDNGVFTNGVGPSNTIQNNGGQSSAVIANAGLEAAYEDIRPGASPSPPPIRTPNPPSGLTAQ
jgi:hypothetical protein